MWILELRHPCLHASSRLMRFDVDVWEFGVKLLHFENLKGE